MGMSAAPSTSLMPPLTCVPEGRRCSARIRCAMASSPRLSRSNTAFASGWSPSFGSSPARHSTLRMPRETAPSRSPCSARRLRSRQVIWKMGSIPFWTRKCAAARLERWTLAPAPSVTLTAVARPLSGSAREMNSAGSVDTGGVISAVTTKSPLRSLVSRLLAKRPAGSAVLLRKQLADDVDRHREDDGRGLVAGDLGERLQVAQLHRLRALREHGGGLLQLFGGLQLAFGVDHLGAPLALGFGLARDGAHHRLVQVDVLDLDVGDLDAPGVGLRVEDSLDVEIELLALRQQLVELVLAQHRAQRGLRQLAGGLQEVDHLDDRVLRVDDAEIDHRVHLHRDVVARDHVLRRHVEHHGAQVDAHHLLDHRDDDDQPRPFHGLETAEQEHHGALVLAQDLDRRSDQDQDDHQRAEPKTEIEPHRQPPSSGTAVRTSPSMAMTRNRCPRRTGFCVRTRQLSPRTLAQPSPSKSSSASPAAPIICSRPVTTGTRRPRTSMPTARIRIAPLAAATPAISV